MFSRFSHMNTELHNYPVIYLDISLNLFVLFFFYLGFFHNQSRTTGLQGKGEDISLTPHYHFHPLLRHLDISRAFTAENSPLHMGSSREPLVCESKSLTTKLRALEPLSYALCLQGFLEIFKVNHI